MSDVTRALLLTPYGPPVIGGISTFVHNLSVALEGGPDWDCWTVARWGGRSQRQVGSASLIGFFFLALLHIWAKRPLVVHAHAHWYTLLVPAVLKVFGSGFRLVFTFHTMLPASYRAEHAPLLEWLLNRCDVVTFVSAALERQISSELAIRTRTAIFYPGVPTPGRSRPSPPATSLKAVGFAGPLVWAEKVAGLQLLLQALARVRQEVPDAELFVAGSGAHLEGLQESARALRVSEAVHFLGSLASLEDFWPCISLYAQVSLQEGMPLALLEAMALGKPVVATPVGGVPEVIEDGSNGVLVSPEPDVIASAIKDLVRNPSLAARLGAAARRTIEDRFTLEALASRATALYARGLASRDRGIEREGPS